MILFTIVFSNYTSCLFAWEGGIQENKKYLGNRTALGEIRAENGEAALSDWHKQNA